MSRKDVYAVLILLAGAAVLALPFLKGPYALFPFHSHANSPWSSEDDDGFADEPSNPNVGDKQSIIYPDLVFSKEQLGQGRMPLWNPHNFAGLPHQAVPLAATTYPLTALAAFLDTRQAIAASMVLHLLLAAFFTYLYLRGVRVSPKAALLGGACWAFSGWMMVHVHHSYFVNTMVWLPLALFATDRVLAKRPRWALMVLAIAIGMMILAGFPQTAVVNLYFIAAYAIIGLIRVAREDGAEVAIRRGQFLVFFGLIGLALASVQLLPTLDYRSEVGHQNRSIENLKADSLKSVTLAHLIAPDLFGNPSELERPQSNFFGLWLLAGGRPDGHVANNYSERSFYAGILALILALLAPFFRRDRVMFTLYAGAILSVLLALGTPLLNVVARLPGMNFGSPMRFTQIAGFALPCLFAMTLDRMLALGSGRLSRYWRGLTFGGAVMVAVLGLVVAFMWLAEERGNDSFVSLLKWLGADQAVGTSALPMEEQKALALPHFQVLRSTLSIVLAFAAGSWLVIALLVHSKWSGRLVLTMATIIVLAELGYYGYRFNRPVRAEKLYEATAGIRFLRNNLNGGRFIRFDRETTTSFFLPNTGLIYGLNDAQGYRAMAPQSYLAFMRTLEENPYDVGLPNLEQPQSLSSPQLDLLRVRYICAATPISNCPLPLVWPTTSDESVGMYIYENKNILPRAFLVHDVRVMPASDTAEEFAALTTDAGQGHSLETTVWLEELPRGMRSNYPKPEERESAQVEEDRPGRIALDLDVQADGILVLTEQFSQDWKIQITDAGGKVRHVRDPLRADMTFMAVPVRAGDSHIVFAYQPDTFKWGGLMSGLALIFLLLVPLIGPFATPKVVLTRIEADGSESWTGTEEEAP